MGQSARAAFPGKSRSRGWLPTTYASEYGSNKRCPDVIFSRHFCVPASHPRDVLSRLILVSSRVCARTVRLPIRVEHRSLGELLRRRRTYAYIAWISVPIAWSSVPA